MGADLAPREQEAVVPQAAHHPPAGAQPVEALEDQGRGDIMIVVGGVIPPQDYPALTEAGAKAIFGPGTPISFMLMLMNPTSSMSGVI